MSDAHSSLESEVSQPRPVAEKPTSEEFTRVTPRRIRNLVLVVQAVLLVANWFLYETWIAFHPSLAPRTHAALQILFPVAAVSFVAASLVAWRYFNWLVRALYLISAVWVGLMTFGLFAAACSWIFLGLVRLMGLHLAPNQIADGFFAAGLLTAFYGLVNAARLRVTRITIKLPNLPDRWRGRVAALVSDMHLGHIRNVGFIRRIVSRLNQLRPDVVFIAGDMYDGTRANVGALAEPLSALSAPLGAFFVTGNHEEFTSRTKYLEAVSKTGVRILNNEKINLDGLQIVGLHYRETANPHHFRTLLRKAAITPERASILLVHAPHRLSIAEQEGISLQLCGHTHGGQLPPATWITSRIYGPYVHGLHRFGRLLVFTNWGAGTWGPPLRVGTNPEIVLLTFDGQDGAPGPPLFT
jgi:predicted MPP superfamily phosphohydrolase